jgi:CRISPR-associated protein Csb2
MPDQFFCISIHFLGDEFHGRGEQGEREWPPSPLRLFQALVAVNARLDNQADNALRWLERQPPPIIVSPKLADIQPRGYKTYVPDNVGDIVAKSWSKGGDESIANYRTEKRICPTNLRDGATVHYIWKIDAGATDDVALLVPAVRAVSQFGWGVDMVAASASNALECEIDKFSGERWIPAELSNDRLLRVPACGTLDDLKKRYKAFLNRINFDEKVFRPVPPLATFTVCAYRRESDMPHTPRAVFALRLPDDRGFAAFTAVRRGLHLVGMLRHLASRPDFAATLGWDERKIASFVLGHGESLDDTTHQPVNGARLIFVPLPSIEWRGAKKGMTVGLIRRVLVTVKGNVEPAEFGRIIRSLEGGELIDERTGAVAAFLRRQSEDDTAIDGYFTGASSWTTVTPVILPGYDDPGKLRRRLDTGELTPQEKSNIVLKLETRIDALLRKALHQAGFPEELSRNAELSWRGSGFIQGTEMSGNYAVSDQHRRFRRLHVRIKWRNTEGRPFKISGPLCIGGGRFLGRGLFIPTPDGDAAEIQKG